MNGVFSVEGRNVGDNKDIALRIIKNGMEAEGIFCDPFLREIIKNGFSYFEYYYPGRDEKFSNTVVGKFYEFMKQKYPTVEFTLEQRALLSLILNSTLFEKDQSGKSFMLSFISEFESTRSKDN